jgi:hypothetical protein
LHFPSTAPLGLAFGVSSGSIQGRVCATFRHGTQAYVRVPLGRHDIRARICAMPPLRSRAHPPRSSPAVSPPSPPSILFPTRLHDFCIFQLTESQNKLVVFCFFSREVQASCLARAESSSNVKREKVHGISRDPPIRDHETKLIFSLSLYTYVHGTVHSEYPNGLNFIPSKASTLTVSAPSHQYIPRKHASSEFTVTSTA